MKHPHSLLVLSLFALSSTAFARGAWDFEGTARGLAIRLVHEAAEVSAHDGKCDEDYLVGLISTNAKKDSTFVGSLRNEGAKVLSQEGMTCLETGIQKSEAQAK